MREPAEEKYPGLKIFHDAGDLDVLFFHDGIEAIPSLCSEGILTRSLCYFTFSWFVSDRSLDFIGEKIAEAADLVGRERVFRHIRLLLNSRDEHDRARQRFPQDICVFFNNAALLNERHFRMGKAPKEYDTVYNARANDFKRHHLTSGIPDKIFVCYDWKWADLDLETLSPTRIFRNVKGAEVSEVIGRARTGLILSEEEGACYASLEYLLCGLPVTSTPSRGGRDEYYDPDNAILCEAKPEAVSAAVRTALDKLESGAFDPARIRAGALEQMRWFRGNLAANISHSLTGFGRERPPGGLVGEKIRKTNKLWKFRNMRIKSADQLKAAGGRG